VRWFDAEVIQYEEIRARVALEAFVQAVIGAPAVDVAQHVLGVGEEQ
jgi:hypothetical protein